MRAVYIGQVRYFPGSGCVVFSDDAIVELTVREEELFDLLRRPPFVSVPIEALRKAMALSEASVNEHVFGIRDKLGCDSILMSRGRGYRLNPAGFVRAESFRLERRREQRKARSARDRAE